MISENRRDEGIIPSMYVKDNIIAVSLKKIADYGYINSKGTKSEVSKLVDLLNIKISDILQPIDSLSGGNQQKVVISKWLEVGPKVFIMG